MKLKGLHPHLILTAMSTVSRVPITMLTLHCLLLSGLRCIPGWTGNRCHVKEKPVPSTAAPEPEAQYLGEKQVHFLPPHDCKFTVGWQQFNRGSYFVRRRRLRGHRHRTAAAGCRCLSLHSRVLQ